MKIGYCFSLIKSDNFEAAKKMGQAQAMLPHQDYQCINLTNGSACYVSSGDRHSAVPMARLGKNGNHLLVTGLPIVHRGSIENVLRKIVNSDYQSAISHIKQLEGAFAITFWDELNCKLLIVTDFLGMQPLYMAHIKDKFLLSSEAKGIAASDFLKPEMDLPGWGSFIAAGYVLGDKTMVKGITKVPAATAMVYDPDNNRLQKHKYWDHPEIPKINRLKEVPVLELINLLQDDVNAYTEHHGNGYLLLSGGYDSRLNACLLRRSQIPFKALILKHHDEASNADGRYAIKFAKHFGIEYKYIKSPKSFYSSSEYLNYIILNDAATRSLYLFIAQVSAYIQIVQKAVWDGAFIGPSLKVNFPEGGFNPYIEQTFAFRDSMEWQAAKLIFSPSTYEGMYEGFNNLLSNEIRKQPDDEYGVSRFITNNRLRNRTSLNPLQVYSNYVLPYTPGLNKEYWSITSSISHVVRSDNLLISEVFNRHFTEALQIPVMTANKMMNQNRWADRDVYRKLAQKMVGARISNYLGLRFIWEPSKLVDIVIDSVNPDHPDLNSDKVNKIKKGNLLIPGLHQARNQLFYWQTWRWLMEGKLRIRKNIFSESDNIPIQ
ncbi:MAG: hypothetical protein WD267_13955 [Balneolales bacterium]